MRLSGLKSALIAAVAAGSGIALTVPAAQAAPTAGPWQIALKVTGSGDQQFTAVTAVSGTSAWAFEGNGIGAPAAYQLSGSTWTKHAFPDPGGDDVFSAASSSASNVWAFTFQGNVLHYNGTSWSKVKHFTQPIGSGVTANSKDAWVFSESTFPPELGTWHFNGSTWTKVASGAGLLGASVLSASNIWGYGGIDVAHWNGSTWKKTSVKKLLPKNPSLGLWGVVGIYAASSTSVYALASGQTQDVGGPTALLHYNGHSWSRVFANKKQGGPIAVVPDGTGGLWIPIAFGNSPVQGSIDHFTGGSLNQVTLPYSPVHLDLLGIASAPHSSATFAVGFYHKKESNFLSSTAVILKVGS